MDQRQQTGAIAAEKTGRAAISARSTPSTAIRSLPDGEDYANDEAVLLQRAELSVAEADGVGGSMTHCKRAGDSGADEGVEQRLGPTSGRRFDLGAGAVGYGQPPKSGQFTKGRSGNPKGAGTATGRIAAQDTHITVGGTTVDQGGSMTYGYDYAGRLITSTNTQGTSGWSQTFTYDAAGRMRTNSLVGTYAYANPTVAQHAPSSVTPVGGGTAQTLGYDANGNMLTGLGGKVMGYDGENRPLSVTNAGAKTCYVYGADGARLKRIDNYTPTQNCASPTATQPVTLYLGPVEIRNFGQTAAERLLLYPSPGIRIEKYMNGATQIVLKSTLHMDGLGSVRAISDAAGARAETASYHPFGQQAETVQSLSATREDHAYIGQILDAGAGLQYLNARYYDPELGLFLQPDWWEVTKEGVGTNRYSYSFNDPVNGKDPAGHCLWDACVVETVVGVLGLIAAAEVVSDVQSDGKLNGNGALAQTGKVTADVISKTVAGTGHNGGPPLDSEDSGEGSSPGGSPDPQDPGNVGATGALLAAAESARSFNLNELDALSFEKSIRSLSPNERVAAVNEMARQVAEARGWQKDGKVGRMNGRTVFRDPETGNYYSVDTLHGRFEKLDKNGKHLGEERIDGSSVPNSRDKSGSHDVKVK